MKNIFTQHPRSLGESYGVHFMYASKFGWRMITAGIACLIHAFLPFLFKKTGSNLVFQMLHDMVARSPVVEERAILLSRTITNKICSNEK
jgi:hypothetical protein